MAEDTEDTRRGRYLGVAFLLAGGVVWALLTTPAAAQSPIAWPAVSATVTPYPGPVATATAAVQQMNQAQQAKAQAAQAQQQAAAAAAQAQQAAAAADASFNAAQQAANEARALLASQQVAAASEALGRAEGAITTGQARVNDLARMVDGLNSTINQQAEQVSALTIELQQARTDKQTILAAYNATQAKAAESESRFFVNPAVAILAGGFLLAVMLVFVVWKWSRNTTDGQPVITGSYTVKPDSDDADTKGQEP